jgi:hypothetical protein
MHVLPQRESPALLLRKGRQGSLFQPPAAPHLAREARELDGLVHQVEALLVGADVGREAALVTDVASVLACKPRSERQRKRP